jgi:hypothetical protein
MENRKKFIGPIRVNTNEKRRLEAAAEKTGAALTSKLRELGLAWSDSIPQKNRKEKK